MAAGSVGQWREQHRAPVDRIGFVAGCSAGAGVELVAIGATTGSGAPGGVFTPTLFVGAACGALAASVLQALGLTQLIEPVYAVIGMAILLAATTHAPVMAALMVFEMTGEYALLAMMLPACGGRVDFTSAASSFGLWI